MKPPSAPVRILAVAGVLALGLVGLVVREGRARAEGQEVRLAMTGYDPRSLLSGHFVQFQLRQDLPPAAPCPGQSEAGASVEDGWVALRADGARHVAAGAASTREAALRLAPVAVRGVLTCTPGLAPQRPGDDDRPLEVQTLLLDLGIDRIHLDQAQAEVMERQLRRFDPDAVVEADALVSVGRDGKARLVGVVVGGKRTDLDWW
ncbi:MAG: GDYXXLXY domain-containing protein [Pseudomonadota bacterium]